MRRYRVTIGEHEFVVRGLNRFEVLTLYRRFSESTAILEIEACKLATSEPVNYDWENNLAGIVSNLFSVVWDISGSDANGSYIGNYVKEANEWLMDTQGKQEAIALACVPGLTLEILQKSDPPDYIKYLWLGQFSCQAIFGIDVERLLSPPPPQKSDQHTIRSTRATNNPPPDDPPYNSSSKEGDYTSIAKHLSSQLLNNSP